MQQFWAIVNLTYKESIRNKIFWIILLFGLLLISSSLLLPVINPADRIKLVEAWSFRGISLFGMIVIIFLAAVSIPEDIEDRKFYILFTKPIPRHIFITGKVIGYSLVMAIFVGLMSLLSLGYLNVVTLLTKDASGKTVSMNRLTDKITATTFSFAQPTQNKGGGISGNYTPDDNQPVEFTLNGETDNYVSWQFERLPTNKLPNPVTAEVKIAISEKGFHFDSQVIIGIRRYDQKSKNYLFFKLKELELKHLQSQTIEFDRDFIDPYGDIELFIQRTNPNSELIAQFDSLRILSAPKNYALNYLKVAGLIFFQITMLTFLIVLGSTFLSSGVTIFWGFFIVFCGSGMSFFKESLHAMERAIHYANPLQVTHSGHAETIPLWTMQTSKLILNYVFKILPDFSVFRASSYLSKGMIVPNSVLMDALGYLALFGIISLLIAWLCFRKREFK
jgi:ABC-type transport system involved in multi-copper enzyme maturation permease subunit